MSRIPIALDELTLRCHDLWNSRWMLLTCGDFSSGKYNTMTVAWGSLGTMWFKPFAQVVVRPVRHTYTFMEEYDTFTLSAFAPEHKPALQLLGSKSGRDGDKIAASGLTPCAASVVAAPTFAEAELVLECRKVYWQDMDPAHMLDPAVDGKYYPQKDYHRIYWGEIVAAGGADDRA